MSLINIRELTFGYDGSDKNLFENVTLGIDTTWRLGLSGRNGRGKTTFLKLLRGELAYSGSITGVPDTVLFPSDELVCDEDWKIQKELFFGITV